MNTSVFYIKGTSSVYYNLEQAIKEAKVRAKCAVIDNINYIKGHGYNKSLTGENVEGCVLKYRVTIGASGSIKVKATAYIPCDNYESTRKKKNTTFSKTCTIYALSVEEGEEGVTFELPFSEK